MGSDHETERADGNDKEIQSVADKGNGVVASSEHTSNSPFVYLASGTLTISSSANSGKPYKWKTTGVCGVILENVNIVLVTMNNLKYVRKNTRALKSL